MRTMLKMTMDVDSSNAAVKDGRLGKVMKATMERWKPEAAYFGAVNGCRGGYIIFDLKDPSDIPVICEPFLQELNATIELTPVMTAEDVMKGVERAFA